MGKMLQIIKEDAPISIGLVIIAMGGVLWLSKLYFLTETNAQTLNTVTQKQDRYSEDIAEIKADIKVIKSTLEGE
jgi:hypothetical protein